jgi:hypothetical protein
LATDHFGMEVELLRLGPFYMRCSLLLLLTLILCGSESRAGMILTNLPGNDLAAYTSINSSFAYSVGITVGAADLSLDSVDFRLKSVSASGTANVELRSAAGSNPSNTVLATFGNQTVSSAGFSNYVFVPNSPFTLEANTTYWLTIVNNFAGAEGLIIAASNPALSPSGPLGSYVGLRFGTPTNQSINVLTLPPPSFQLNGTITAVPEPAWLGTLGSATVLLVWLRRRRHFGVKYFG